MGLNKSVGVGNISAQNAAVQQIVHVPRVHPQKTLTGRIELRGSRCALDCGGFVMKLKSLGELC